MLLMARALQPAAPFCRANQGVGAMRHFGRLAIRRPLLDQGKGAILGPEIVNLGPKACECPQ
jgi:hypothetical protein